MVSLILVTDSNRFTEAMLVAIQKEIEPIIDGGTKEETLKVIQLPNPVNGKTRIQS